MTGLISRTFGKTTSVFSYRRYLHLFVSLVLFSSGCSSQIIDDHRSNGRYDKHVSEAKTVKLPSQRNVDPKNYANLAESKTIKFSFKPDAGQTYIKDADIDNLFKTAKEAGYILLYETLFLLINQQYGEITFTKGKDSNLLIIVEVIVTVSDNKQMAYVFLTVNSTTKESVESALFDFKEAYKTMLESVKQGRQQQRVIEAHKEATRRKPDFAGYNDRGNAYANLGQHKRAIKDYDKAIRLKPDHGSYNNRGISYTYMYQYNNAQANYDEAIRMKPDDISAYYNYAWSFSLQKDATQACIWLRRAIERGYKNWKDLQDNNDFQNIRSEKCFVDILNKYTK